MFCSGFTELTDSILLFSGTYILFAVYPFLLFCSFQEILAILNPDICKQKR
jgi:hypothetical protein